MNLSLRVLLLLLAEVTFPPSNHLLDIILLNARMAVDRSSRQHLAGEFRDGGLRSWLAQQASGEIYSGEARVADPVAYERSVLLFRNEEWAQDRLRETKIRWPDEHGKSFHL
ncbi:hypothetical protein M5K25_017896 [Dendrobium thyrsiflorum]|uniref:Uncharacterized protein n=1 Tax=Dendrobium thyrsiflorum TaxID=117978 RepID=A0ABD0UGQ0_DENTH